MKNIKEINIAFIMGSLSELGGIQRVTSILSNELNNVGFNSIHLISYHKLENHGYDWNDDLISHALLPDNSSMVKGILKASIKLRRLLKKNNINVLIICGHNVGPFSSNILMVY